MTEIGYWCSEFIDFYLVRTILFHSQEVAMGKGFGNLGVRVRHIITYSISPYEQRIFTGFLKEGFPNLLRRSKDLLYFVPGVGGFLLTYYYGNKAYERNLRKNPKDYENDV